MKKNATRLLYVFSFSLLFTALYLNFVQKDTASASLHQATKNTTLSSDANTEHGSVAQPENNTALK
jgi:hypothetical protein